MDRLQEANLKRGYLVGPRSEDEMVRALRASTTITHQVSFHHSTLGVVTCYFVLVFTKYQSSDPTILKRTLAGERFLSRLPCAKH